MVQVSKCETRQGRRGTQKDLQLDIRRCFARPFRRVQISRLAPVSRRHLLDYGKGRIRKINSDEVPLPPSAYKGGAEVLGITQETRRRKILLLERRGQHAKILGRLVSVFTVRSAASMPKLDTFCGRLELGLVVTFRE
jgi:hypothetical protein